MKVKESIILFVIIFSGVILYTSLSSIFNLSGSKNTKVVTFSSPEKTGKEGLLMPSFTLLLSDSVTYINTKDIPKGRPIVLFYFSPYCPFCQAEIKEITKNIDKLKDIQFYVLTPYPYNEMMTFYNGFNLKSYSNIKAAIDINSFFGSYFNTVQIPYLAIYGKEKKLNGAFIGGISSEQIYAYAKK
ncbi:TlpA family protein disulfide reductase [Chitinophaga sp.]|uniref:TlpA family protein disulfide reductase n=1 Tax=Chitinophaga sp. TaxID=1869181 RepID=UPI002F94C06E